MLGLIHINPHRLSRPRLRYGQPNPHSDRRRRTDNVFRGGALFTVDHVELHLLTFRERLEAFALAALFEQSESATQRICRCFAFVSRHAIDFELEF